jgi:hypothetical protein
MPRRRQVALVPVVCALLLAGAPPVANGAESAAPPETVVINDTRTSAPVVDIAKVRLEASWYWDSQQSMRVKVPNGYRPGHLLTVWFDIKGDAKPDGHFELRLSEPKRSGGKSLQKDQEFRIGGGWGHSGTKVSCTASEGGQPAFDPIRRGQRNLLLTLDLWDCLQTPTPGGTDSGSWRVAVRLAKGKKADMAPNNRRWSAPVAGWGPCDPSGGPC